MPEKLTEAELNQKLSTIGLPTYGTYEEKLARLELHSKPVAKVFSSYEDPNAFERPVKMVHISNLVEVLPEQDAKRQEAKGAPVGEAAKRMFAKKGKK